MKVLTVEIFDGKFFPEILKGLVMPIINSETRNVTLDQWAHDVQMVSGVGMVEDALIRAESRVKAFSQSDNVSGSLRAVLAPGVGFTIRSSEGSDAGLVYCEVIL